MAVQPKPLDRTQFQEWCRQQRVAIFAAMQTCTLDFQQAAKRRLELAGRLVQLADMVLENEPVEYVVADLERISKLAKEL